MDALILNPSARLRTVRRGGRATAIVVESAARGRARQAVRVGAEEGERFALLSRIAGAEDALDLELSEAECDFLAGVGLLVAPERAPRPVPLDGELLQGMTWSVRDLLARYEGARREFREGGYAILRALLPAGFTAALARRFRALVAEGQLKWAKREAERRLICHNERAARVLHEQLTPVVADLVGAEIKPSYVLVSCYQPGAVLARHTDRAQCVWSISLQVDYEPITSILPAGATPWPLFIEPPGAGSPIAIGLAPGDGILYRGGEIPHWRERLPEGHRSTSLFFHYVDKDFDGSLD